MRFVKWVTALAVLVGLTAKLPAATVVIDTLKQGPFSYVATGANVINGLNQSGVDTLNGRRASSIDHLFSAGSATLALNSGGPLSASADNFYLNLGYGMEYSGGMGTNSSIDLNTNLSNTDSLKVSFGSTTNPVSIQVFLMTNKPGGYGDINNNGHAILKPAGAGDAIIPYSLLTNSFNGGANLSDIDAILLGIQSGGSFTITQIAAVPEPSVLAAPLLLLGVPRRRRRRWALPQKSV
jgi:hypothetical protein